MKNSEDKVNQKTNDKFNIDEKFSRFSEHWRPKIVAALNGQEFKLAKIEGEYPFHAHDNEDEMFFCWKGSFVLEYETRESVHVNEGEGIVVPKGVVHRPVAEKECLILLIEPADTKNSGNADVGEAYDAPVGEWV